jgi:hypothetical protein
MSDHAYTEKATILAISQDALAAIKLGLRLVSTAETGVDEDQAKLAHEMVKVLDTEGALLITVAR